MSKFMQNKLGSKLAALGTAGLLTVGLTITGAGLVPAHALRDVNLDADYSQRGPLQNQTDMLPIAADTSDVTGDSAAAMPGNPNATLPDTVASSIPDSATVVSEDYATTTDGQLKDLRTGVTVTDPELVGTKTQAPDPLAKTDGESFIPVDASEVKDAVEQAQTAAQASATKSAYSTSSTDSASVRTIALDNNEYGAHWGTYNGTPAFFDGKNRLFVQNAKGVIDISEWQGNIDWVAAKADGVEGAIIRIGYGTSTADKYAKRNIQEVKRLGIPFGVYLYSYAYDSAFATEEGQLVVKLLREYGVSPSDLSYPVYYDLERWTWTGHTPPTDPGVYDGIVNSWYAQLRAAGYNNLSVYSYTSYLSGPLNSANIHSKTRWVAQYGAVMQYTAWPSADRGWQYTSGGSVAGIAGRVDLNAFGTTDGSSTGGNVTPTIDVTQFPAVTVRDGEYFINAYANASSSIDIPSASKADGVKTQLWGYGNSAAQKFRFTRQSDGSYTIVNVNSGKALEVKDGAAKAGATVQQRTVDSSARQRWFLRDSGAGYYLQSALGNVVLDLVNGSTANGTTARLWTPNGTNAQQWLLASAMAIPTGKQVRLAYGANTNMVIDVPSANTANFVPLQVYQSNNTAAQRFVFTRVGNGLYEIRNVNSGKNMDAYNGGMTNGTVVQQYQDNDTPAQRWLVRDVGNGTVMLVNSKANRSLDVPNGEAVNGMKLRLWEQNGTVAQRWMIVEGNATAVQKVDVYRMYLSKGDDHLLTATPSEIDALKQNGWTAEGVSFLAASESAGGLVPVWRFYNRKANDHVFTTSNAERESLREMGWSEEGIAFYAPQNGNAVFRLYNPRSRKHHFTPTVSERDSLVQSGWTLEGDAFYGYALWES